MFPRGSYQPALISQEPKKTMHHRLVCQSSTAKTRDVTSYVFWWSNMAMESSQCKSFYMISHWNLKCNTSIFDYRSATLFNWYTLTNSKISMNCLWKRCHFPWQCWIAKGYLATNWTNILQSFPQCWLYMYVCMYVCMYVWMHACLPACLPACMYVCMYVLMCSVSIEVLLWMFVP